MSLHWFRLWLGAAYTTHYCLNQWWQKPMMYICVTWPYKSVNTWRPRQNDRHLPDIFKYIFLNENIWILIKISLKSVPEGPIYNIPASVQIMAWRRPGDKQLSEPMVVRLPTHMCVTRPQLVNVKKTQVNENLSFGQIHIIRKET